MGSGAAAVTQRLTLEKRIQAFLRVLPQATTSGLRALEAMTSVDLKTLNSVQSLNREDSLALQKNWCE